MPLAYYNGKFIDKGEIKISLADYGFSRGLAFFETMRVYGGVPFRMSDHLERLRQGAEALGLALPVSVEEISKATCDICFANKFPHSIVKYYFTAGENRFSPYSFAEDHGFMPKVIITEDEMKPDHPEAPYGLELYRRGLRVKTVPHERALPQIKSISYLQAYIAAREAGREWDDILFTHRDGYITEASRANFFCVLDGVLCTPGKNVLDGVTRKVILEIAGALDIPAETRDLYPEDLERATEAFLSGSPIEMIPVRRINDHEMTATMDAPVFRGLREAFTEKVKKECSLF